MSSSVSPTTGKLFAAYALKAASGDAKSAVSSAASAVARAVFQMAHAGNKTPLIEAAKVAQELTKKKAAKAAGAVAGFLAVTECVDFIDYSEGYIFDKRIGADKAMEREKAHEIEADCVRAFITGFNAGVVAYKETMATKKSKDEAVAKITEAEAVAASEVDAAENAINMADKVLIDMATVAHNMGISALAEALERCPAAASVITSLAAVLAAQGDAKASKTKPAQDASVTAAAQLEKAGSAVARAKVELSEIMAMYEAGTTSGAEVAKYEKRLKTAEARHEKATKTVGELTA